MRVLIACVGYRFLRDRSVGPALLPALERLDWPPGVELLDLHFGPIHAVHWFEDLPAPYDRIVFLAAAERGRAPGTVRALPWDSPPHDPEDIQARVTEAVTGVIDLDNLLIITDYFGVLPTDVVVVEVEPADTGWGPGFSPTIEAALPRVIETVRAAALRDAEVEIEEVSLS